MFPAADHPVPGSLGASPEGHGATTAAGLPRRRPMAHHVPGADDRWRTGRGRDAGAVRRTLTAYQQGLHRRRRRAGSSLDSAPHPQTTGSGRGDDSRAAEPTR
ncbi:MAG: hypothetical protein ACFCVF_13785 [Kineosporiaceae bacterium]